MAAEAHAGNRGEIAEPVRHAATKLSQIMSRTAEDAQAAARELAAAVQHAGGDLGEPRGQASKGSKACAPGACASPSHNLARRSRRARGARWAGETALMAIPLGCCGSPARVRRIKIERLRGRR
jgi:hypothetical protein